jgi:predicted nucleotidyltransferase
LLDFSTKPELRYLAALAAAFRVGAGDTPFFLAGATARDLLLLYAHGIHPGRDTRDADLALMVPDWETFEAVRARLIAGGQFTPDGAVLHKLVFGGALEVDLIPFGAVEDANRTIAWPPAGDVVMTVFGFREVFDKTIPVRLPDNEEIRIVSLPALAVLKLVAWKERRLTQPRKDAYDLAVILRNYLEAGNHERLYTDAVHLLEAPDFDFELAGAWLLGHDMAQLLPRAARQPIADILSNESDPQGPVRLAGDMPIDASLALAMLKSVTQGFLERTD